MATRGRPKKNPAPVEASIDATGTAPEKAEKSELSQVMAQIGKRFGNNVVSMGHEIRQPWRIPLGIFSFDLATCGGIPHNRITMFHGPRSSGKTTAAMKAIAGAQRSLPHMTVVLLDVEGTYDEAWARKNGIDTERLIVIQPETGESAVDMADAMVRTKEVSLLVLDSIAALVPNREIEGSAEDAHVGIHARLVTTMVRKLTAGLIAERHRGHFITVLVVNQERSKIGGWAPPGQEPLSLPGGKALEFSTTLQVKFKNKENLAKDDTGNDATVMNEHAFTIGKNKMHGGIRKGEYQLMRADDDALGLLEGDIDDAGAMLAHAKRIGCYTGGGKSWTLNIPDFMQTFSNADEAVAFLYANRDVYWLLRCHLIASHAASLGLAEDFVAYLYGDVVAA